MPIYEYICNKCQKPQELMLKITEADNEHICECGGKLVKQVSRVNIRFAPGFLNYTPLDPTKPYKGYYYDDEYVERQDSKNAVS